MYVYALLFVRLPYEVGASERIARHEQVVVHGQHGLREPIKRSKYYIWVWVRIPIGLLVDM
jgi:hypothetical protein